jgi:hypothetical protein
MNTPPATQKTNYWLLPLACLLSAAAFFYLNNVELASPTPAEAQKAVEKASDKTAKKAGKTSPADSNNYSKPELTPDVQLLNFVIRKGREGIPVLFARYIF